MATQRIRVLVKSDGLSATVDITSGEPMDKSALLGSLRDANVKSGIDFDAVDELATRLGDPNFAVSGRCIAQGQAAITGADGKLELEFKIGLQPGTSRADGSVDLFDRAALKRIASGEVVAKYVAAGKGQAGRKVNGEAIPAKAGTSKPPSLGPGVTLSGSGVIKSKRNGTIQYRPGGVLDVLTHVEHRGDVDIQSGHLETDGSLTITGTVMPDFAAKAAGDIEIRGDVTGGRASARGSVLIKGTVAGGDNGRITAAGDIFARRAQSAQLRCNGKIQLTEDSVSSRLHSNKIDVGRRILGGEAVAETLIVAHQVGSESGAGTLLWVAEPFESNEDKLRAIAVAAKATRAGQRRGGRAAMGSGARRKGGKNARSHVARDRETLQRQQQRRDRRRELLKTASIEVRDLINRGVEIRFGNRRLHLEISLPATRFVFDSESGEISPTRLEP